MTKETTDLGLSSMYLVYNTVTRSLQLNPLHRQASGDSGCSFRVSEVAGAGAVSDSFRFLLYFPVRLYFPLVPGRAGQKEITGEERKITFPLLWFRGWNPYIQEIPVNG